MLSLGKMRNAAYYLAYTVYYLQGGEPVGKWIGKGAERLGLIGTVRKRHFKNIFRGYSPAGDALVKNAGSKTRNAGIDLTFSAPKGVSVLWAIAPKRIRHIIQRSHNQAVRRALRFLEEELLTLRRGKQGIDQHSCELVAALFQHSSSRQVDPSLHTHALVFNLGHAGGRWNAVDARAIYSWKMALGAIYRTELVNQLWNALGLPFELIKTWVEVKGMLPKRLLQYFSKRSADLRRAMQLHGSDSARASDMANLRTRSAKRIIPSPELFRQWRREAKALGFGRQNLLDLLRQGRFGTPTKGFESLNGLLPLLTTAVHDCIEAISRQRSHFSRRQLIETFLPRATEFKVSADIAIQAIDDVLRFDQQIVEVDKKVKGEVRFATRKTIAQETALKKRVSQLKQQTGRSVPSDVKQQTMLAHSELKMEQYNALDYLVDGKQRIKALGGGPGSGKTTVLKAARRAWEEVGLKVIGGAIAGRAARNLEHKSGIESSTVRKLQIDLEAAKEVDANPTSIDSVYGLQTYPLNKVQLDQDTVLVVDEAGMVDTADTLDLLNRVDESGATLVLVGDEHQLPPIGAGAPFDAIKRELIHASLTEIRRFHDPADKEALRLICEGKPEQALQKFTDRALLSVEDTLHDARQKLVSDVVANGGINRPQDHVILVCTNAQRDYFNDEIQKLRQEHGAVAQEGNIVRGELLANGDRVMFLRNHRDLDVRNGDIGTVTMPEPSTQILTVSLDSGRSVNVPLEKYDHLTRAYAATVHKFQGADVPNTYCLLGGSMQSMEFTHTQLSRHQITCRLYTDKVEAGDKLEHLCRQIRTPSRECLAIELMEGSGVNVSPPDSGVSDHKKIAARIRLTSPESNHIPINSVNRKHDNTSIGNTATEHKPPVQSSQLYAEKALKDDHSRIPRTAVAELSSAERNQRHMTISEPERRPYIRLKPENHPPEPPQKVAVDQPANVGQSRKIADRHESQPRTIEIQPVASTLARERQDGLAQVKQTEPNRILSADPTIRRIVSETDREARNGVAAERQVVPLASDVGSFVKQNVDSRRPQISDQSQLPSPQLNENQTAQQPARPLNLTAERFAKNEESGGLSRRLVEASKTFDEPAKLLPSPLVLVVSNDRPKSERANTPESNQIVAAISGGRRSTETLLERELRIAREAAEMRKHEYKIDPPVDPPRSGPKPS